MKKIFYLLLTTFLFVQCEKWNLDEINFLEITTSPINNININQGSITSEIKGIRSEVLIQHGHVWSASSENPTIQLNDGIDNKGGKETDGNFTSTINNLETNTIYYARGYAQTKDEISYGNTVMFTSGDIMVSTDSLSYSTAREATVYGNLCCVDIDITIDQHGICWSSTNPEPNIENDQFTNLGVPNEDGSFSSTITGLEDSTLYYYRSYVITNFGSVVRYGEVKTWNAQLVNIWEQKTGATVNGILMPTFTYNGKGYFFGFNRLSEYDPLTDTWSIVSIKSGPFIWNPVAFVDGDYAYFLIGTIDPGVPDNKCWRYNLVTQVWEDLDPFPGTSRVSPIGFAPGNGKCYLGVGSAGNDLSETDFWEYDPSTNNWTQMADYPGMTIGLSMISFVVNEIGYVGGGAATGLENLFSYDYQTNTWEEKNTLPGGQTFEAVTFTIDQTAYIGTGESDGNASSKTFWKYNHMEDTWTSITDFGGAARFGAYAFSIGDKGYVGGGINSTMDHFDFWEYKPKLD